MVFLKRSYGGLENQKTTFFYNLGSCEMVTDVISRFLHFRFLHFSLCVSKLVRVLRE